MTGSAIRRQQQPDRFAYRSIPVVLDAAGPGGTGGDHHRRAKQQTRQLVHRTFIRFGNQIDRLVGAEQRVHVLMVRQQGGCSVHGTLNHLLVANYIWMRRFTGDGPIPERLSQIMHEDFAGLWAAREKEDN